MKVKIIKSDIVNGSVYLAGTETDLGDKQAKACVDAGIAVILPVSVETPTVDETKIEPVQKLKREKGA